MRSAVCVGVDTHRDQHVAVALDEVGGAVAEAAFPADRAGYEAMLGWARSLGDASFAIEGTGSYGAGLARHLADAGVVVFEAERPQRRSRRRGKSDLIDAEHAARRLLNRDGLTQPRGTDSVREQLRLLLLERRGLVQMRTAEFNRIHAIVLTASEELRERYRGLDGHRLTRELLRRRTTPAQLRRMAHRAKAFTTDIAQIDRQLDELTHAHAAALRAECGVGPVSCAQLLVSAGTPGRLASEASFAALAGVSPVQASTGTTQRHRLNRGGDRHLNNALHTITLIRVRYHAETTAYYTRLRARGKTPREARRIIKRALARHLYRYLRNPLTT